MPQSKPIPKLKEMALKKVACNIFGYVAAFQKPKSRLQEKSYQVCQKQCSDQLLHLLINTHWDEEKTILQKIFSRNYDHSLYENCTDFIFNEHLTELILKSEKTANKYLQDVPDDLLQIIMSKKLTEVYYPYEIKDQNNLRSFVQHSLTNVVSLNLKRSGCNDITLRSIWHFCPHIEYLNLSYNEFITDRGMLFLCNIFDPRTLHINDIADTYCFKPLQCSLNTQLKVLIIKRTGITNIGLQCALQHLTSLTVFRFRRLNHFLDRICCYSIPYALALLYNHRNSLKEMKPEFTTNLEELTISAGDYVPDVILLPVLCPRLKVLNFHVTLKSEAFSAICNFSSITEVSMSIEDSFVFFPEGMRIFFTTRGEQLTNLRFHGSANLIRTEFIYDIVSLCPNLRNLHLKHFRYKPPSRILARDALNRDIENIPVLKDLESLTICGITGIQEEILSFISGILVNAHNLRQLTIGLSRYFLMEDINCYLIPSLNAHGFPQLRKLILVNCDITENLLNFIVFYLNNLREIKHRRFSSRDMLEKMEQFTSERNFNVEFSAVNNESSFDFMTTAPYPLET